jgi:hypothetical protein
MQCPEKSVFDKPGRRLFSEKLALQEHTENQLAQSILSATCIAAAFPNDGATHFLNLYHDVVTALLAICHHNSNSSNQRTEASSN